MDAVDSINAEGKNMAAQNRHNRGRFIASNNPVVFDLDKGAKVLNVLLILTGTAVISGGTTNGSGPIGEGGPMNLIQRLRITATPGSGSRYWGGDIVDSRIRSILDFAITQQGGKKMGELSGSTLGNGAAGSYPIYLPVPIYFANPEMVGANQVNTALNMDKVDSTGMPVYENVQVKIDLAQDLTGCFAGNDRAISYNNLSVQWDDSRIALSQDTLCLVQTDHDVQIPAANTRLVDFTMPRDGLMLNMLLQAEAGTSRTLSDALLNRLRFQSPSLDMEEYALDMRTRMFTDGWYDLSQNAIGQYFVDFSNGIIGNSVDLSTLAMEMDVNNPSGANLDQFKIFIQRLYPLLNS